MRKRQFKRFMLREGAWKPFTENYDKDFPINGDITGTYKPANIDGFLDWFFEHEATLLRYGLTPISMAFDWNKYGWMSLDWMRLHRKYKKNFNY